MLSSPTTTPPQTVAIVQFGDRYQGKLQPKDEREREHCYQVPAGNDLRLDLKTDTRGTIRFTLFDRQRQEKLHFDRLTNPTNIEPIDAPLMTVSNIFTLPNTKSDRLLCLTTSNRQTPQQYEFKLTKSDSQPLVLIRDLARGIENPTPEPKDKPSDKKDDNSVATKTKPSDKKDNNPAPAKDKSKDNNPVVAKDKPADKKDSSPAPAKDKLKDNNPVLAKDKPTEKKDNNPAPIPPAPPAPPAPIATDDNQVANNPQPDGCYIGTWQVEDLSQYWLPTVQTLTQAKIENPIGSGNAKLTFTADGKTQFEAKNFQQKYTLKSKTDRRAIDEIDLKLQGQATATYRVQPNNHSLLIANQTYDRLNTQLQLATGLELTGGNLFRVYGDTNTPSTGIPYQCVDARRLKLFVPAPTRHRLLPINLRRV